MSLENYKCAICGNNIDSYIKKDDHVCAFEVNKECYIFLEPEKKGIDVKIKQSDSSEEVKKKLRKAIENYEKTKK